MRAAWNEAFEGCAPLLRRLFPQRWARLKQGLAELMAARDDIVRNAWWQQIPKPLDEFAVPMLVDLSRELAAMGLRDEAHRAAGHALFLATRRARADELSQAHRAQARLWLGSPRRAEAEPALAALCNADSLERDRFARVPCATDRVILSLRNGRPKSARRAIGALLQRCASSGDGLAGGPHMAKLARLLCEHNAWTLDLLVRFETDPNELAEAIAKHTATPFAPRDGARAWTAFATETCQSRSDDGRHAEALACVRRLRAALPPGDSSVGRALDFVEASAHLALGAHAEALALARKRGDIGGTFVEAEVLIARGDISGAEKLLSIIEAYLEKAAAARSTPRNTFEARSLQPLREDLLHRAHMMFFRARIAEHRKDPALAGTLLRATLRRLWDAAEAVRSPMDPEAETYASDRLVGSARSALIRLAMAAHTQRPSAESARAAWEAAERQRGHRLESHLARHPRLDASRWLSPDLARREQGFVRRTRVTRALLTWARHRADAVTAAHLERLLAREQAEHASFVDGLRNSTSVAAAYAALRHPAIDPEALGLRAQETLIQFHVDEHATYRFVVRGGRVVAETRPIGRAQLAAWTKRLLRPMRRATAESPPLSLTQKLYAALLGGIDAQGPLLLVPDGPLWELPFEMFVPRDSERPIGLERSIAYLPSASWLRVLRLRRAPPPARRRALIVGDVLYGPEDDRCRTELARECAARFGEAQATPRAMAFARETRGIRLVSSGGGASSKGASSPIARADFGSFAPLPGTRAEAQHLRVAARAWGVEPVLRLGADASESAIATLLSDPSIRIAHLATHGVLSRELPGVGQPALVLAAEPAGSEEDGLLTSREILARDVHADLVVLSACKTQAGATLAGEGPESLAYAFLFAGARAVVGSLWSVEDQASSALMRRFYTEVSRGVPVPEALRRAREHLWNAGRQSPFYWAPFVVVGGG
jgi:CHAT domain-containing protein